MTKLAPLVIATLLAACALEQAALPLAAQARPPVRPVETPAPVIDPAAKQHWDAYLAASRLDDGDQTPITAFRLEAFVRARSEGSNDLDVAYEFQAPNRLRFSLRTGRTIGHGNAVGLAGYWLAEQREGKREVVRLVEREHADDRRQIDSLIAIAKNFVALSAPENLRLERLELSPGPKSVLPDPRLPATLTLEWIRLVSPDFGVPASASFGPTGRRPAWVEIGFDRRTSLPRLIVVGHERNGALDLRLTADPVLLHVPKSGFAPYDGYLAPGILHVHRLVPTEHGPRFARKPDQEITLEAVDLAAEFPERHFEPDAKGE
ncbi:MAG: hypothetical protein WD226_13485 [Planctomycetota bacterium]